MGDDYRLAETLDALKITAVCWAVGGAGQPVVDAAADALAAGHDTPSLRVLAGATRADADADTSELGPRLFEELGLAIHPRWFEAADLDWVRYLVRQHIDGERSAESLAGELGTAGFTNRDGPLRQWADVYDNCRPSDRSGEIWRRV